MCQTTERAAERESENFEMIDSKAKQSLRHRQRIHVRPHALDHQVCEVKQKHLVKVYVCEREQRYEMCSLMNVQNIYTIQRRIPL